jgi:protocatechuate 3,4-dioxygenase beta subunit
VAANPLPGRHHWLLPLSLLVLVLVAAGLVRLVTPEPPPELRQPERPIGSGGPTTPESAAPGDPERSNGAAADLRGEVRDLDGRPLADARIVARPLTPEARRRYRRFIWTRDEFPGHAVESDAEGRFAVAVPPGAYAVEASADGFARVLEVVEVGPNGADVSFALRPELAIEGVVVPGVEDGPAVPAHVVALRLPDRLPERRRAGLPFLRIPRGETVTGPGGTFRIGGLLPGRYELFATSADHGGAVAFVAAGTSGVRLVLGHPGAIEGDVRLADGTPVAGAEIFATDRDQAVWSDTASNSDGGFRLGCLSPGLFTLHARHPDHQDIRVDGVKVTAGPAVRLDLVFEAGHRMTGRVVDDEGGPVAGATVVVSDPMGVGRDPVVTDAEGRFEVGGLGPGSTWIVAEKAGHGRKEVFGFAPDDEDVVIVLGRAGGLRLRVRSLAEDRPLERCRVRVHREGENERTMIRDLVRARWRDVETPGGTGRIQGLTAGTYVVEAAADGHAPARVTGVVVPPEGTSEEVVLELDREAVLEGRVVLLPDETPVGGVRLTLMLDLGGRPLATTDRVETSAVDGSFRFGELAPGRVSLTVTHPGLGSQAVVGDASREEGAPPLIVRLSAQARIVGRVLDPEGRPVPGAAVRALPSFIQSLWQDATTDEDGRFAFESLAPGSVRVVWVPHRPEWGRVLSRTVELKAGEQTTVDLRAEKAAATLTGEVRDAEGPVAKAAIGLFPVDAEPGTNQGQWATADDEGRFRVRVPRPGRYVLTANDPRYRRQASVALDLPAAGELRQDLRIADGTISGRVTDAAGEPLVGAAVLLFRGSPTDRPSAEGILVGMAGNAEADAEGRFVIRGVGPGDYYLRSLQTGRGTTLIEGLRLGEGEHRKGVEITLRPDARLRLALRGPDGPVEKAHVLVWDTKGRAVCSNLAVPCPVENGCLAVRWVAPGTYRLLVRSPGHADAILEDVRVTATDTQPVLVGLVRGGTLRVRILDADDRPVPRAHVHLVDASGWAPFSTVLSDRLFERHHPVTDAAGRATVRHVTPGAWSVRVSLGDREGRREGVTVTDGATTDVEIRLER